MSDIPMTAEAAPATTNELPTSTDETVQLPNPVNTEATPEEKAEAEAEAKAAADKSAKKLSVRETLEAAAAKVDKADKDGTKADEVKPEAGKEPQPRENGKFVTKDKAPTEATVPAKPAADAPVRFTPEAKAAWANTPEPVKAEVQRSIKNLEAGLEEHSKRWAPLKEFDDLAKATGTSLPVAMKNYVEIDKLLGTNFPAAMQRICQNKGVDIRAFAADVLQLPAEARQALRIGGQPQNLPPAPSREVTELRQQVARLEQQIGGVTGTMQEQQQTAVEAELAEFSADKPLFNELSAEIAAYITNDGLSYQDAYAKAVEDFEAKAARAGFITRPQTRPSTVASPAGQPSPGSRSIKGAPGPGSSPATRKPSNSIREALERAAGMAG